jgi:hypothetical protein
LAALFVGTWVGGVGFALSGDNCAIVRWRDSYKQGANEAGRAQQAARSIEKVYFVGERQAIFTKPKCLLISND